MTDTLAEHADSHLHKGEPLIEMDGVGKAYGAIRALRGINLRVNAGEVTCVLGDNGAGKSTLIKIMSACTRTTRARSRSTAGADVQLAARPSSTASRRSTRTWPVVA
jgi:ABC-type sugar transport system ATPase subunit